MMVMIIFGVLRINYTNPCSKQYFRAPFFRIYTKLRMLLATKNSQMAVIGLSLKWRQARVDYGIGQWKARMNLYSLFQFQNIIFHCFKTIVNSQCKLITANIIQLNFIIWQIVQYLPNEINVVLHNIISILAFYHILPVTLEEEV